MNIPQSSSEEALRTLLAKHEIAEVLYRYCQGCDRSDEEILRACFHLDSTHDHAGYVGKSHDWVPLALEWLRERSAVTHMVTNLLIQVNGARALSDCHFVAYNRCAKTAEITEEFMAKGRYIDRLEQRDGVWRITHRIGLHDLERAIETPSTTHFASGDRHSGKAPDDPYYEALAAFLAGS